jgi:hypothetical protein
MIGPPSLFASLLYPAIVQSFDLLYEARHRQLSIAMLRSFLLRRGLDSGRHVSHPDRRLGSIDVLAARPARPHSLPSKISRGETRFVDWLQNLDGDEPVRLWSGRNGLRTIHWTVPHHDSTNRAKGKSLRIEMRADSAVPASEPGTISTALNSSEAAAASRWISSTVLTTAQAHSAGPWPALTCSHTSCLGSLIFSPCRSPPA